MSYLRASRQPAPTVAYGEGVGAGADLGDSGGSIGVQRVGWFFILLLLCVFAPARQTFAMSGGLAVALCHPASACTGAMPSPLARALPVVGGHDMDPAGSHCGRDRGQHCTCPLCHGSCGHCPKPLALASQFDVPQGVPALVPVAPSLRCLPPVKRPHRPYRLLSSQ